jgi:hypothetical protein
MEVGLGVNFTGSARAEDLARVTTELIYSFTM